MRINKYKISKKRRLRRRGKYSKKLKPKSRKSGGRFLSFFRGHEKNKVTITATCAIPDFFFTSHGLFCQLMGVSMEQTGYPDAHIDISVYGDLLEKNKTGSGYTLSVKLDSDATIDDVYFSDIMQLRYMNKENELKIAAPDSDSFNVKFLQNYSVTKDGNNGITNPIPIQCSEYTAADPEKSFVCNDTDDHILKSLLQLWRKKYTDQRGNFDDFFKALSIQYPGIVTLFRNHDYRFNVEKVILSSS